jgi:hypothetical protein
MNNFSIEPTCYTIKRRQLEKGDLSCSRTLKDGNQSVNQMETVTVQSFLLHAKNQTATVLLGLSGQSTLSSNNISAGFLGPLFSFTQICYDAYMQETASGITENYEIRTYTQRRELFSTNGN